jgi:glycine oxidase
LKTDSHIYDFIIVGQGLAGTMMTHFLLPHTENILVVDAEKHCASFAAAGIINPVTGRHYVKSWLIDSLLPFAEKTYQDIGQKINIEAYQQLNILRTLHNVQEENDWMARVVDEQYQDYLCPQSDDSCLNGIVKEKYAYGEIRSSLRVKLKDIILTYRAWLKERDLYMKMEVDSTGLIHNEEFIELNGIKTKKIIFCEGYKAMANPLFSSLPFKPAKGNALIIKCDFDLPKNLRDKLFITPIGNGLHWVGSGYQFELHNELPDEKQIALLKSSLDEILAQPYEIVEVLAGIRPTVKTRKPLIGSHPSYKNIYLFNGLGTKGSSLAPYFADMLVRHIYDDEPILEDVAFMIK